MTFRQYAEFFQPHEMDALTAAYDAAWQHMLSNGVPNQAQATALQKKLAQVILASACTGEREVERLKDIALRSLSGGGGVNEARPVER
jgi:hypothetical protein